MGKRIVIFHYHLNPGGVTRIVESQVESLLDDDREREIIILCGKVANKGNLQTNGVKIIENELFNYIDENITDYHKVYQKTKEALLNEIKETDILHVHNLNLGKNPIITLIFSELAREGYSLVNHAHDFAEDREKNWKLLKSVIETEFGGNLNQVLYPSLNNYLFACLNSFDYNRLLSYGVERNKVTMVPNPVIFSERSTSFNAEEICETLQISPAKKTITYPVRVIRRKNIGEFILLCYLFQDIANWVVTQPPKNPVEITPYEKWKNFCLKENIPVCFEAGTKVDFEALIKMSDYCITTSIQEGFGMVYMEPWLLGTPVIGRDIEMVTKDLINSGVSFPLLYNSIQIDEGKDFGQLDMDEQILFILKIKKDANTRKKLFQLNPFLNEMLNDISNTLISENKNLILKEYSLEKFSQRLNGIYKRFTE